MVANISVAPLKSEDLSLSNVIMTPVWRLVLTKANIAADTQVEASNNLLQSGFRTLKNIEAFDEDADLTKIATSKLITII